MKSDNANLDAAFIKRVRRHVFDRLRKHKALQPYFDEIVSEILLGLVVRGRGPTVDQLCIDAIRKFFGRTDDRRSKRTRPNARNEIELKPAFMKPIIPALDSFLFIDQLADQLEDRERIVFILKIKEDWTAREIAAHLGVHEVTAAKYFESALETVKAILDADERFVDGGSSERREN